jgi:dienelactone hydrolase
MQFEYRDGDQRLLGELEVPDAAKFGPGPYPGVVVAHEAWGLSEQVKRRARMLADLGYLALAADIFGERYVPKDPPDAFRIIGEFLADRARLRTRAAAAVSSLKGHAACNGRLAAIGFCFGGSTVLELARGSNPDILAVVSFHGGLSGPGPVGPEGIRAKILVLHGAEDPLVPHADLVAFLDEMKAADADCQTIAYTGAVHAFTNPEADGSLNPGILYHDRTDKRAWAQMEHFLRAEVFI